MRRLLTTVLVALAGLLLLPAGAHADETSRGAITDVRSEDGRLLGVLTVDAGEALRSGDLRAELDGARLPIRLTRQVPRERTVVLVIDTSGSMGLSGMATVRGAVREFLDTVPTDVRVGVASFAETSGLDLAPTRDRREVQRNVDSLVSRGDTDLYGGVRAALRALQGRDGDRSVVLLSDGADTVAAQPGQQLSRLTGAVRRAGIRVDVVRFNTDDPVAVRSLRRLSDAGSGQVSRAGDPSAVAAAFAEAAGALTSQVEFAVDPGTEIGDEPHDLVITGRSGGRAFRAADSFTVRERAAEVPAASAPGQAARAVEEVAGGGLLVPVAASALLAGGVFLGAFVLLSPELKSRRTQRVEAIEGYLPWSGPARRKAPRPTPASSLVALSERIANQRRSVSRTTELLHRADLPFTVGEWLVVQVLAVTGPILLGLLLSLPLAVLVLLGVAGLALPPVALRVLAARRAARFEAQLPDVLMLIATSLGSGFGLTQAFDAVISDSADPLAKEFARAQAETRLGADLIDALGRVADRMDSTTLRWTLMAMRIQTDVGGSLAETLRTTARTLRDRAALHGQVRALSAEGRLSAYILIALPIGVFCWMLMVNRDYIQLLWTDPIGMLMSGVAIALLVAGVFWMRKVVEIEV